METHSNDAFRYCMDWLRQNDKRDKYTKEEEFGRAYGAGKRVIDITNECIITTIDSKQLNKE